MPVVDQRGGCVGVLSDVDVHKFLGHFLPSEQVAHMKTTKVKCVHVRSMPDLSPFDTAETQPRRTHVRIEIETRAWTVQRTVSTSVVEGPLHAGL